MKKKMIGILIIVVVAIVCVGGYTILKSKDSIARDNSVKTLNTTGTNTNVNVIKTSAKTNSENSEDSINWSEINGTEVLSNREVDNLSRGLKTIIGGNQKLLATSSGNLEVAQKVKSYINEEIVPKISEHLTGQNLSNFNEIVSNFNDFCVSAAKERVTGRNATSANNEFVHNISLLNEYSNMAVYLICAYTPNGNSENPMLSTELLNNEYTGIYGQNDVVAVCKNGIADATSNSEEALNNMGSLNKSNVLSEYSKIYDAWNVQLNNIYNYLKENTDKIEAPQVFINTEENWINFKNRQIEIAGNGLTGINKEIAEKREEIILTQLRVYNISYTMDNNLKY